MQFNFLHSLHFISNNFPCSIFKFTNFYFCYFYSVVKSHLAYIFVCFKYVFYISRYSVWVCFNKFHLTLHCVHIFIEHLKYACVCTILMFIFDSSVSATGNWMIPRPVEVQKFIQLTALLYYFLHIFFLSNLCPFWHTCILTSGSRLLSEIVHLSFPCWPIYVPLS